MVRMRSTGDFFAQPQRKSATTVIFIGPLGQGVGLAADILSDVARLAQRSVTRDRRLASGPRAPAPAVDGFLHVVRMEEGASNRLVPGMEGAADLVVAWNVEAALAFAHLLKTPDDLILLETQSVPSWRRELAFDRHTLDRADDQAKSKACGAGRRAAERPQGVFDAVRALGLVGERLPFEASLWREVVPQHVPHRLGQAALDHFFAAGW